MPPPFHAVVKPVGGACNLVCDYCFYRADHPGGRMPFAVLEAFTEAYVRSSTLPDIAWQGGEPMLAGLDFYREAMRMQAGRARNSIQTNGTLIDDDWCRFFRAADFYVGVSIDGPRHLHDRGRRTRDGARTHPTVRAAIRRLRRWRIPFALVATITEHNVTDPQAVFDELRDLEPEVIQLIPGPIDGERFGDFMLAIRDRRDQCRVKPLVRELCLETFRVCTQDVECGRCVVVEHDGSVYSCDHFVRPEHRLGNVLESDLAALVYSEAQRSFGAAKAVLPKVCEACSVLGACRGGCPKDRDAAGMNRLCAGYRRMYSRTSYG